MFTIDLTPQQAFDTVYLHLKAQGRRAVDEHDNCLYRADDGRKCAAGCLIPDEHYHPDMEAKRFADLGQRVQVSSRETFETIRGLQHVHDSSYDDSTLLPDLRAYAFLRGFTVPT